MKKKPTCTNCYSVLSLCISFLVLGLVLGNWMGKCTKKNEKWKNEKCKSYYPDGKSGSTCNWSKKDTTAYKTVKKK